MAEARAERRLAAILASWPGIRVEESGFDFGWLSSWRKSWRTSAARSRVPLPAAVPRSERIFSCMVNSCRGSSPASSVN